MLTIAQWFRQRRLSRMPVHERTHYSLEGDTIRLHDPVGQNRSLDISHIDDVSVETNSLGPFAEDVFWLINRESDAIRIPQGSPVFEALLNRFEILPGFDWEAFGRAMKSTDDAVFTCWLKRETNGNSA